MIPITELRLGNYIIDREGKGYNNPGIVHVRSITSTIVNGWKDMGASGGCRAEDVDPVVLTPEVLEKCGFEITEGQIPLYKYKNIYMCFDGEELSANFGHIEQLDVYIKYLHRLQNLTFALTGTELTYTP